MTAWPLLLQSLTWALTRRPDWLSSSESKHPCRLSAPVPVRTNPPLCVNLYSPVVELNRAVAVAMNQGPEAGIVLIDAILERGDLADYHLAHSARAELYRRSGQIEAARESYARAIDLTEQEPARRFLERRLQELEA